MFLRFDVLRELVEMTFILSLLLLFIVAVRGGAERPPLVPRPLGLKNGSTMPREGLLRARHVPVPLFHLPPKNGGKSPFLFAASGTKGGGKGRSSSKSSSGCRKSRTLMYVQQVAYCQYKSVQELYDAIAAMNPAPERFAVILHDHDVDDQGNPVAPHFHAMMKFRYPRSLTAVATELGDKSQSIELWNGKEGNGFAYLCHRTVKAADKFQYAPSDVLANFNYPQLLADDAAAIEKQAGKLNVKHLLELLKAGQIDPVGVKKILPADKVAKLSPHIKNVWQAHLEIEAEKFRAEMRAEGKTIRTVWIYGPAGSGKTRFAIYAANKLGQGFFKTGTRGDPFQGYNGEHKIIWDELRPGVVADSDLLRILDPYGIDINAPSRYYDKALAVDLIFVTTPYHPKKFWDLVCRGSSHNPASPTAINTFAQLGRRINLLVAMDQDHISEMVFDIEKGEFVPFELNLTRLNPFSSRNSPPTPPSEQLTLQTLLYGDDDA